MRQSIRVRCIPKFIRILQLVTSAQVSFFDLRPSDVTSICKCGLQQLCRPNVQRSNKYCEHSKKDKMTAMKRDLTREREEADEKLVKRMKLKKPSTFKKKSHEVQYRFNEDLASRFATVSSALKEAQPAVEKAATAIEKGEKLIAERNKLIRISDKSVYGWATVAECEEDELADH